MPAAPCFLRLPRLLRAGRVPALAGRRAGSARPLAATLTVALLLLAAGAAAASDEPPAFRPPAVPLVVHDPYVSCWSMADRLTDDWPRHWTGKVHALCGLLRIDGRVFRWCGPQPPGVPEVPALEQRSLSVAALSSVYVFAGEGVELRVTFWSPALPWDLDALARPVGSIDLAARATDGRAHELAAYLDVSAEWVVNTSDQPVQWSRVRVGGRDVARLGRAEQRVLGRSGDDVRLDWGWLYLLALPGASDAGTSGVATSGLTATAAAAAPDLALGGHAALRGEFIASGSLPASDDLRWPRPAADDWPVAALRLPLGRVDATPRTARVALVVDELRNLELFEQPLRPWWRRGGREARELLEAVVADAGEARTAVADFERALHADLVAVGGERYAQLCELALRQVQGAHGLAVDGRGRAVHMSKENFSNGCIDTVDVVYPASPFYLLFNPGLLEAQLRPLLEYASSDRWPHPFAPHDLGTYPKANGQVYGGGERSLENQMPVEECGNMLLMVSALVLLDGRDTLAREHAELLDSWAGYLEQHGFDPEHQLCTDDFAGHLARNANLALKAVLAVGAWGRASAQLGRERQAEAWSALARRAAHDWRSAAGPSPTPLAWDTPGTWSQKYNLVWDELLDLRLFPAELAPAELAHYRAVSGPYGPPLDSRRAYTKLDWCAWTAAFAGERAEFESAFEPLWRYAHDTPQRVPLGDLYETADARHLGMQARSVVGGLFLRLLQDRERAAAWRERAP